jgi:hypothetical protein
MMWSASIRVRPTGRFDLFFTPLILVSPIALSVAQRCSPASAPRLEPTPGSRATPPGGTLVCSAMPESAAS